MRSIVHRGIRRTSRRQEAVAARRDGAERHRAVRDVPGAVLGFGEPHRLAGECAADEDEAAAPLDLAVRAHPPDLAVGWIGGLAQHPVEATRRGGVMLGRRRIGEPLVRTLLVVEALEGAEARALLSEAAGGRAGGLLQ